MDHAGGQHGAVQRVHPAGDQALQAEHDLGGDHHGIERALRPGRVAAAALHADLEVVRVGADRTRHRRHLADRDAGIVVRAEHHVAGEAVEQPFLHHHLAAAAVLLGRLEDEMHRAVEVAGFGQVAGGAQQHGGVAVMAAGMHHAGVLRAVFELVGLGHRQRVHVRPDADCAWRVAVVQGAHQAGAGDAARDLYPPRRKLFSHEIAGAVLAEGQFGVHVDIAAPGGHFRCKIGDAVVDGHVQLPRMVWYTM